MKDVFFLNKVCQTLGGHWSVNGQWLSHCVHIARSMAVDMDRLGEKDEMGFIPLRYTMYDI